MATSQYVGPKYGEKGAQMRIYPQRHQAPKALQRAMGNDKMCMEMCPSPGLHLDKLGDRADPLPPERKKMYQKKKARVQAARAKAIRSLERGIKSPRKTVAKRKPLPIENTTPPPEQPPPLMTVFPSAPPPPALSASQNETSIDSRAQSPILPRFTFSYSVPSVTLDSCHPTGTASTGPELVYKPPQTAKNDLTENALNATSFEFYAGPQSRHASDLALSHSPSPNSTPSLESDRGTPSTVESPRSSGTWIDGPTPTPQSPSTPEQLDCRLSVPQRDVDSEELFNEVYQSFFIPRSSWNRQSPTLELEHGHMNPQSVIPETPHKARNTVQHIPDRLDRPTPPQPATMSHPDLRTRDLMPTTTTTWTSTPQGSHSQPRHLHVPATTPSGMVHDHQRRGPAGKGAAGATGTPGVHRLERGTFGRQHAPPPYPSHFTRVAAGHTRLNHSLATPESPVAAQSAGCGTTPSIAGAVARQAQVRHHDGSAILDHAPHNNPHHLSMRTSPSHVHSVHANSVPLACTTPVPPVNSITQHQFGAPNTTRTQRSQPMRTSKSAYSELAHALVDPHSIAPLVEQAGIGERVGHGHLYSAQVGSGAIGSSRTSAPEPLAHWQIDPPIASHPILDHPLIGPGTNVMVAPSTSRAQATHDDDMARTLGGCFEECEPFSTNIMACLLGTHFANRQRSDETYLEASWAGSQSEVTQQLLTTPTCQEAQCRIHHPYPPSTGPSSTSGFTSAPMQGASDWRTLSLA
ncbi:hypothetical protein GSI_13194 [Ganoderma sinense ZZ0214-1]|uniref:Uncharacterized protein n=1 Tax=Ganoderma sinense ZZ0214-1 TaxID=1077348 RepID=A0A2G8RUW4_9APHY|nr:hypothetical protein GSI_13194 [Ganoderma sinense ZZ0214-1]